MNKTIFILICLLYKITLYSQPKSVTSKYNLDFEKSEKGTPVGWNNFGEPSYILALDSSVVKKGKYSVSIKSTGEKTDFKAWAYTIPENYDGEKITLSGYIKTENVTDGYAGLWLRIDPNIAFDNMGSNGIKGTTDWKKYEITLAMDPKLTKQIVVGGLLVGKGKMWIDNLSITIDGKEIEAAKLFARELLPADNDKEFDNGSAIKIENVTKNQTEDLKTLGLVWGFLKYYHPNVAKGMYNWDYELFRVLPKVLNSVSKKNTDDILVKWVQSLGSFTDGKEEKVKESKIKIQPDLNWIQNSNFSPELTSLLTKVKNSEKPKEHYYISFQTGAGNPEFKNEKPYTAMKFPDAGFRILSLYRYWNIIQYYFPYKNLIEEDWKNVLPEFIPKIIESKNEKEYTLTTLELIGRINDTHANIWGSNEVLKKYFGEKYAAVDIKFIENKALVMGYFDEKLGKETGLEIGDVITSVNNKSIDNIIKEDLKYAPASNYPTKLRDIASKILRTNDSLLNIEFVRADKKENRIIKTYSSKDINIYKKYQVTDTCFKLINKDISYINNGAIKSKDLPIIWKDIKNTKGLIIDNRNYPSDFVIYNLCNYLMPESIPFVKFSNGSIQTPGLFTTVDNMTVGEKNSDSYKGKVIILVNETSQSSSEYHALAYRVHPNATVIGSTTAGADGNVSSFYLPGGINTMISGIGVYYPDGKETQRVGIVPNIIVKPTIEGIKKGQDELLERAIELINSGK